VDPDRELRQPRRDAPAHVVREPVPRPAHPSHAGPNAAPAAPRRVDVVGERITRPFSLQAGTLRNAGDAIIGTRLRLRRFADRG
jgi:hypothetical protein